MATWVRQQVGPAPQNEEDTDSQKAAGKARRSGSRQGGLPAACMDGKHIRSASKQTPGRRRILVAAVEHGSGLVLGQREIGSKTNEIPAVRELAGELDPAGRIVTFDALHARQATARRLCDSCRVCVRDLPRHLACLANTAISSVQCQPQFACVPEAGRHFAPRPQEALDLLLAPPRQS